MPDDATPQAQAPAAAAAPAPEAAPPAEGLTMAQIDARNAAKMAKHVALAQKANAAEDAGEEPAAEPEKEPGEKKAAPGRDPETGKFLKGDAKPKAEKAEATTEEPEKTKAAPAPKAEVGDASITRARKLLDEGHVAEALKVAFGKDIADGLPGKNWEAYRRENRRAEKEVIQAAEIVERDRQVIQRAATDLQPLFEAKKAWEAGDPQKFVELATGLSFNDFQKLALQKFHGVDPEKVQLRKEMAELRRSIEERDQKSQQSARQAAVEQQTTEWKSGIAADLRNSDDERFAAVASKRAFVDRVFAIQAKHFDKRSDTTLPTLEAAEMALEEIADEYGVALPGAGRSPAQQQQTTVRGSQSAASGPGRTPVRQAKANNLRQSEAAEASAPVKLTGDALMQSYIRKAQAEIAASE